MKASVENKIVLWFAVSLLALASMGWLSYHTTANLVTTDEWVSHTHEVIATLESGLALIADAESSQRAFLLAEDNQHDVELTLTALEEYNLANEVVVVRDGVEALDYLHQRGQYANHANGQLVVVLLDLKMPKVGGLEVLREIRATPVLKHMPVVMVTSSREEQDLVNSYQLGVNAYVVKPVDFQKFMESIRQVGFFWAIINEPPPGVMKRSG